MKLKERVNPMVNKEGGHANDQGGYFMVYPRPSRQAHCAR